LTPERGDIKNMTELFICPVCGEIVNDTDIDRSISGGGMPYCDCQFSAVDENGEIWFPRRYVEYKEIGIDLTDELLGEE
jgi:hypothetical protein